jgi:hypothetical protein
VIVKRAIALGSLAGTFCRAECRAVRLGSKRGFAGRLEVPCMPVELIHDTLHLVQT